MGNIEKYLDDIEGIFKKHTKGQSDEFALGLRICAFIRDEIAECGGLEIVKVPVECTMLQLAEAMQLDVVVLQTVFRHKGWSASLSDKIDINDVQDVAAMFGKCLQYSGCVGKRGNNGEICSLRVVEIPKPCSMEQLAKALDISPVELQKKLFVEGIAIVNDSKITIKALGKIIEGWGIKLQYEKVNDDLKPLNIFNDVSVV